MFFYLIGDPSVDDRMIRGFMRHAKVEPVNGLRRHIPLQGIAMLAASERALAAQKFPRPFGEMIGMIGMSMDVVDFVRNEITQSLGELLIARGKLIGVFHVEGSGGGPV